jgi:hypothetical protein
MGRFLIMLGLGALPLLAFGYGIYRGGRVYVRENLFALLILAGVCLVDQMRPRFRPAGGVLDPEHFLAALLSLSVSAFLLYRATSFMFVPPPGICGCGYNLTGNTSGICPECGRNL